MRPQNALRGSDIPPNLEASFWSLVQIDWRTNCWLWQGMVENFYGRFKIRGRVRAAAHRVAYALTWGYVPADLVVRHRCDNKLCVAPHHLELGSDRDNANDRVVRGRHAHGERAGTAILTEPQVRQILQDRFVTSRRLAEQHGVSRHTVSKIRQNLNWKHIPR